MFSNKLVVFSILVSLNLCESYDNSSVVQNNDLFSEYQNHILKTHKNDKSSANSSVNINSKHNFESIQKNFKELNGFFTKIITNLSPIEDRLKQSLFEFLYSVNLTDGCLSAVFQWFRGLKRLEPWAYECKNLQYYGLTLIFYLKLS